MRRRWTLPFLLSALLLLALAPVSLAGKDRVTVPTEGSLLGKKFELSGNKGVPLLVLSSFDITFGLASDVAGEPKTPYYAVDDGCGTWGAYFEIQKGRLVNTAPGWSQGSACDPDPGAWLSRKFSQGWKIRTKGKLLLLSQPKQKVKLVLSPVRSRSGR